MLWNYLALFLTQAQKKKSASKKLHIFEEMELATIIFIIL